MDNYEIIDNTGVKPFIGAFDKTKVIHYTLSYNKTSARGYSERDDVNRFVVYTLIKFLKQVMEYRGYISLGDIYRNFNIGDDSFCVKDYDQWGILFDKDRDDEFIHITTPGSDNDFMFFHGYENECELHFDLVDIRQAIKARFKKLEEEEEKNDA